MKISKEHKEKNTKYLIKQTNLKTQNNSKIYEIQTKIQIRIFQI